MSTYDCFRRLIDDAAIFPPGNAALGQAVRAHHRHRASAYAAVVGPLLVRDTDVARLDEIAERPVEIGVVSTSGPEGLDRALDVAQDSLHVAVTAVEIAVPVGADVRAATEGLVEALHSIPAGVRVSVELPRPGASLPSAWVGAAAEIDAAGFQAKFRTGGTESSAYPDEDELAAVLGALVPLGHRVKLTAGLHRAVRNTQAVTGFEQHGFLNVLVAVHRLVSGATTAAAAEVLRDRNGRALADVVGSWTDDDIAAVRQTFRGFGSCSVTEPCADLVDLELIA